MERLQKVLAQAGLASRRAAEQIILAGRVRVDGKIVRELGTQVDPRKSRVEVDGNKIVAEKLIYIVLHKPRGVVCTLSDPEGRPTIHELLKDAGARVVPVGRLDFHTSGALLCTNDGEFAQALAHPKKAVPKVYVAKVKGAVDDDALERFSQRIVIDGRPTQPAQVKRIRFEGDKTWLEITLREGRNRQVRRLGEATGFPVMRLARISHAGVTSEDLRPGQWRPLSIDELVDLKRDYGVPKKVRAPQFEPALGKGGWSDEPRAPGARRVDPKFSAAKRRDAKPARAGRPDAHGERFNRAEARANAARSEALPRFAAGKAPDRAEPAARALGGKRSSERTDSGRGFGGKGASRATPSSARSLDSARATTGKGAPRFAGAARGPSPKSGSRTEGARSFGGKGAARPEGASRSFGGKGAARPEGASRSFGGKGPARPEGASRAFGDKGARSAEPGRAAKNKASPRAGTVPAATPRKPPFKR